MYGGGVPLATTLDGYHDASGTMCGGMVLPGPVTVACSMQKHPRTALTQWDPESTKPIVWCAQLPPDIVVGIFPWSNQGRTITKSDI